MRLTLWVGCFVAGVSLAIARSLSLGASLVGAGVLASVSCVLIFRRLPILAFAAVCVAAGLCVGARAWPATELPTPIRAAIAEDRLATVSGWVVGMVDAAGEGARLRVAARRVDGRAARATIGLVVVAGAPSVHAGDAVRFRARLHAIRGLANPGVADSALQARASGLDVFAGVGTAAAVERVPPSTLGPRDGAAFWAATAARAAGAARTVMGRSVDATVDGQERALLHTAVLGERWGLDPAVEDGFRAAGTTHALSVSGLHLAAVAIVFFAGLRAALGRVPRLPLWFDPRRLAAVVALPGVVFYTLLTGAAIATVRSALMTVIALVGVAIGRRGTLLAAIAATVLMLVVWSPLVVVDISFQLSVVSVLALALAARGLAPRREPAAPWWRRFGLRVASMMTATLAAALSTGPLVAHDFGEVTPAAPLGNLILVPLIELVVVPFGLAGAALGAVAGRIGLLLATPFMAVASWGAWAALHAAEAFRVAAPVWLTRAPNAFETLALSLGAALALSALPRAARSRRVRALAAAVALGSGVVSLGVREGVRRFGRELIVTFLDVGQGDSAVVQFPGGRSMLIDGGGTWDGTFDPGARVLEPFLRARGITRVDVVALSHPHPDHMGGLHRILQRFSVGALWTSGDDGRNPDYARLLDEARAHAVASPVPTRWTDGRSVVEPLGPWILEPVAVPATDGPRTHADAGAPAVAPAVTRATTPAIAATGERAGRRFHERIGPPEGVSVNDASLVLRAAYAGRAFLFAGDLEADGEGELVGRRDLGQVVAADVLKVPHHGSRTSSSDELLDAVRPGVAVMSLGWRNRFHFPRPEVVARYRTRGVRVLRTDQVGAVTITVGADGAMRISCARGCWP